MWRLKISGDYLYVAAGKKGFVIYDISNYYNMVEVTNIPLVNQSNCDGLFLNNDSTILYVGNGNQGIYKYDITDKANPVLLGCQSQNGDTDSAILIDNEQYILLGNGFSSLSLVETNQILLKQDNSCSDYNPVIVWENDESGTIENIHVNNDESLVFLSLRDYGFIIIKIDIFLKQFIVQSKVETGSTEMVLTSTDEKFLYCSNEVKGIEIYNIEDVTNPYFISQHQVNGFPTKFQLVQYPDLSEYLFINLRDKGFFCAMNVTDINQIQVLSYYNAAEGASYDNDCNDSLQYCFILGDSNIHILKIDQPLQIHSQLVNYQNGELYAQKYEIAQIGQELVLSLTPIGITKQIQINDIKYYKNYNFVNLPSWVSQLSDLSIQINANKEGLDQNDYFKISSNLFLLNIFSSIETQDFVQYGINQLQAQQILTDLQDKAVINEYNILTQNLYSINQIHLKGDTTSYIDENSQSIQFVYDDNLILSIYRVLQNSNNNIPVPIKMQMSLSVDPQKYEQGLPFIETYSQQISFFIQLKDIKKAVFVVKPYSAGVASDNFFDITAPLESALNILSEEVLVFGYTNNRKEIFLDITIDDGINPVLIFDDLDLEYISFLKFHPGIRLDSKNTIQQQFNLLFSDGVVGIEETFNFQFSDNTFTSLAGLPLKYKFYYTSKANVNAQKERSDQFSNTYLEINEFDRKIKGNPKNINYGDEVTIIVLAQDDYVELEDQFIINVTRIPFLYVLQILIQVLPAFIILIFLYIIRGYLYAVFCKKKYRYETIIVKSNQEFRINFLLVYEEMKEIIPVFQKIIKSFKSSSSLVESILFINQYGNRKISIDQFVPIIQEAIDEILLKKKKKQKKTNKYEKIPVILEDIDKSQEDSYFYQILKSKLYNYIITQNLIHNINQKIYMKLKQFAENNIPKENKKFLFKSWTNYYIHQKFNDVENYHKPYPQLLFIKDNLLKALNFVLQEYIGNQLELQAEIRELEQKYFEKMEGAKIENEKLILEDPKIQEYLNIYNKNLKNQEIYLHIILEQVISENLGLLNPQRFEYSKGMCLLERMDDIFVIKAMKKRSNSDGILNKIYEVFDLDWIDMPMTRNSALPGWLNYKYHYDVIELFGFYDLNQQEDKIKIRIQSINNIIIKEFIIQRENTLAAQHENGPDQDEHMFFFTNTQIKNEDYQDEMSKLKDL